LPSIEEGRGPASKSSAREDAEQVRSKKLHSASLNAPSSCQTIAAANIAPIAISVRRPMRFTRSPDNHWIFKRDTLRIMLF
jgi:hypothetical protein